MVFNQPNSIKDISTPTIQQRLDNLLLVLQDSRLLNNRGIGNEIGFYIFDYDPEHEPLVQQQVARLMPQLTNSSHHLKVEEINLCYVVLKILQGRGVLQKAFDLEATKGSAVLSKTIFPLVRPAQVIDQIQKKLSGQEQLVFLTGVGRVGLCFDRITSNRRICGQIWTKRP